jgi:hypothetical protein
MAKGDRRRLVLAEKNARVVPIKFNRPERSFTKNN